jgi:hypothetical protein
MLETVAKAVTPGSSWDIVAFSFWIEAYLAFSFCAAVHVSRKTWKASWLGKRAIMERRKVCPFE